jgi:hypothetical protein
MSWGFGKRPVTAASSSTRVVFVGKRQFTIPANASFHDFLEFYVQELFGKDWLASQARLSTDERHPFANWLVELREFSHRLRQGNKGPVRAVAPATVAAFLSLAWDLYTLEHNEVLQERLLMRLRVKDQFQGALYELFIAGVFIRAGFAIELEDESDGNSSHCEFAATHTGSGLSYSVEAKSRHRPGILGFKGNPVPLDEIRADTRKLLVAALRKEAKHERIVFIDVNVPPHEGDLMKAGWFNDVSRQVVGLQESQRPSSPWPKAHVFFTNRPFHYVARGISGGGTTTVYTGVNHPMFDRSTPKSEALAKRELEKYPAIQSLLTGVSEQQAVPVDWPSI